MAGVVVRNAEKFPPTSSGWEQPTIAAGLADPQSLVVSKKEHLVLDDRAAQRKAELVLLVRLLAKLVEIVGGIEFFIAQELPNVAVDLICARLDDGIHDGAVAAAKFRAVGIGLDLELGDGVHRRLHHVGSPVEDVAQVGVVVDAVEQEVVLQRACAVGAESVRCFDPRAGLGRSYSSAQQSEMRHSCGH